MNGYRIAVVSLCVVLAGCGTPGAEVKEHNNEVQMPHYRVVVPANKGWHLVRSDDVNEAVALSQTSGSIVCRINVMRNAVLHEEFRGASAKFVADDFRNREKQIMIEQGVNRGMYEIAELLEGEETVGSNKFYTMDYRVETESTTQYASLYLYFPKDQGNDFFILAHFAETSPHDAQPGYSSKSDFIEILKSMRVTQLQ